jgi:pimeloyl-ACP methyl ester carboxylesterase
VWLVEISATQDWDPRAGTSPFDLTTDVRLMAQQATVLADGVHRALAQAQAASEGEEPSGAQRDQPAVMLVGHSLGGIAAAGLASSPRFTAEHRVTHVVTMGAPVGRMPIPSDTQVLSLEHTRDPVPRLEGQPNPDRATWVTVTRDALGDGADRASRTHDVRGYVETAALVDGASDPSVTEWRSGSAAFFAGSTHGPPVIRDYLIRRVRP